MADVHTARLCAQIVNVHFGPLTSSVVSVLLTRGRLSLFQLARFTSLKPRTVRTCLLVLIQHNIVYHDTTDVEGEVFEVNVDECLMRLRFGKYVWQAEQVFGKVAAEIVQLILDHGKLKPPDVRLMLGYDDHKRAKHLQQALHKLITNNYLKPSTILSHHSPRDKLMKYEAEEKAKISGFPTAKQLKEAKEVAQARLRRVEDQNEKIEVVRSSKDASNGKSSKRKTKEDQDDGVYFRVNYDRFHLHTRDELIEMAARERYNNSAALVMRAALKATESKSMKLNDIRSEPTSIANISTQISSDDDIASGIVYGSSSRKHSQVTLVKDYLGMLSAADNPSPSGRDDAFVSLDSTKVYVEFETICRRLRRRVLESVTMEKHGQHGVRLMRLLIGLGKMDEKQIAKTAMMAPKDVRVLLSAMSADSLVTIQEVPKSADRNPSRTFYLWYVDLEKALPAVTSKLYKTLYNISKRRDAEKENPELKPVLEKKERTDISVDQSLLTRMERELIQQWESKQERLTVLEERFQEAVFILRDLDVFSMKTE